MLVLELQVEKECKRLDQLILRLENSNSYGLYYLFMAARLTEEIQILFCMLSTRMCYTLSYSSNSVCSQYSLAKRYTSLGSTSYII